ncbi:MAG: recombination protein O N-terminal domain-containing protein [Muribaculaceae bacterium]|nr:recombination protein O N-terminal domain-containing protein [Muribaculaceae bacterium]
MLEKIQGIVVDIRRHNDRHNVVTLFTRQHGRIAFLSTAGSTPAARLKQARLYPLAIIETEVNFKKNRELQQLRSFQPILVADSLRFNPVKATVVMFVSEFLNHLLRTSPPDPAMWDYVANAISVFNASERGIGNFHLTLLVTLLPFMGIQPDLNQGESSGWFDMQGGVFTDSRPLHNNFIPPEESIFIPLISRMNFANYTHFRFNGAQRRMLLRRLLDYYALHLPGMNSLKSPDVLADIFS